MQAGDTPYDILDFEDELTTTLSQAGYMLPLNDLISQEVWDDLSPSMKAYTDVWSTYNGEVFRMIHNWEMPYWFYRKDWFDERGVDVPKTWDDVKAMGSDLHRRRRRCVGFRGWADQGRVPERLPGLDHAAGGRKSL